MTDRFFSLPGAIGMYGLSVGVAKVGSTLPNPVYALLSGLNAATVGIIALAAVRLSERAITDKITRFLVYLGAIMGMLYTSLWYYPVIMAGCGLTTCLWDARFLHDAVGFVKAWRGKPTTTKQESSDLENCRWVCDSGSSNLSEPLPPPPLAYSKYNHESSEVNLRHPRPAPLPSEATVAEGSSAGTQVNFSSMTWQVSTGIIAFFVVTFILTIVLHAITKQPSRGSSLFSSFYLAGTIIFGGGPVVVPLLREYIVSPGWVSPRDFLLGVAIIQSFPGPNFNFAIYLGSLAVAGTTVPSYLGAIIAFVAMYAPGMFIIVGVLGLWRILREKAWFLAILRGVNAAAVGLVFTAVYKLWEIGYLTAAVQGGSPLGSDPWLVAITGTAFVGGAWFKMSPPVAILLGGVMGITRYGIITR